MTSVYIFDIDGTIADRGSSDTYSWFNEWLRRQRGEDVVIALASNQGGVGLRYWMESDGFGNPDVLPTESEIVARVDAISGAIMFWTGGLRPIIALSYAYQAKETGLWGPIPPDKQADLYWQPTSRKPNIGMIRLIQYGVLQRGFANDCNMLFIGNSDEDEAAARAAGIGWCDEEAFFADILQF